MHYLGLWEYFWVILDSFRSAQRDQWLLCNDIAKALWTVPCDISQQYEWHWIARWKGAHKNNTYKYGLITSPLYQHFFSHSTRLSITSSLPTDCSPTQEVAKYCHQHLICPLFRFPHLEPARDFCQHNFNPKVVIHITKFDLNSHLHLSCPQELMACLSTTQQQLMEDSSSLTLCSADQGEELSWYH